MKVLTISQPWATLIMQEDKRFATWKDIGKGNVSGLYKNVARV